MQSWSRIPLSLEKRNKIVKQYPKKTILRLATVSDCMIVTDHSFTRVTRHMVSSRETVLYTRLLNNVAFSLFHTYTHIPQVYFYDACNCIHLLTIRSFQQTDAIDNAEQRASIDTITQHKIREFLSTLKTKYMAKQVGTRTVYINLLHL